MELKRLTACMLALLLCLAGCAAKGRTPEERIADVVTTMYTLPAGCYESGAAYAQGRFRAEDFAPGVLEEFTVLSDSYASEYVHLLGIIGPRYSRYGINGGFPVGLEKMLDWADGSALACKAVESEPREDGLWQFSALLVLTEATGTQTSFNVHGTAQFDRDGKFTGFHFSDDGGLSEYLEDEIIFRGPDKIIVGHSGPTPGPPSVPTPAS